MEDITSWTSIDLYYKGFHVKKSLPQNVNRVTLMAEIDDLIQAGFQPSWNPDTNKASVVPPTPQTTVSGQSIAQGSQTPTDDGLKVLCKGCKSDTTYRTGFNKETGKPWKGYFCNSKCGAKPYFVKD